MDTRMKKKDMDWECNVKLSFYEQDDLIELEELYQAFKGTDKQVW